MQLLSGYALTLIGAALISGVLLAVMPEGTGKALLRLVCGVFLMATALSPLAEVTLPDWESMLLEYQPEAREAAAAGEEMAALERTMLIKTGLEAYILDKASALGCSISADVQVDAAGIPASVRLHGNIPETVRMELSALITNDLGIPEEDQQWTGEN